MHNEVGLHCRQVHFPRRLSRNTEEAFRQFAETIRLVRDEGLDGSGTSASGGKQTQLFQLLLTGLIFQWKWGKAHLPLTPIGLI